MSRAIFKMRAEVPAPTVEIVGEVLGNSHTSGGPTHNLGNIDVGELVARKHCILGLTYSDGSTNSLTVFTVGGVSLLPFINTALSSGTPDMITWGLIGDISALSGSQPISASFSGSVDASAVSGVAVTGLVSTTPVMETIDNTDGGQNMLLSQLRAEEGGIIFAASCSEAQGSTMSWSSMQERVDLNVTSNLRHSAAWDLGERAALDETITTTGNGRSAIAMSFAPGGVEIIAEILGQTGQLNQTTHDLGTVDVGPVGPKKVLVSLSNSTGPSTADFTIGGIVLVPCTSPTPACVWGGDLSSLSGVQPISITFNVSTTAVAISGAILRGLRDFRRPVSHVFDSNLTGALLTLSGVNVPSGGFVMGNAISGVNTSGEATWTNLTKKSNVLTNGGVDANDFVESGAWDLGFRDGATDITVVFASGTDISATAAGFR